MFVYFGKHEFFYFSVTVDSNEPDENSIPEYLQDFVHFDRQKWM